MKLPHMDTARTALQVGLLVFMASVLLVIGFFFFNGAVGSQKYYSVTAEFDDAQGIEDGAEVDLAGVRIGEVAAVNLSSNDKALVIMRIQKRRRIPRGSLVTISTNLLGGSASVIITPPSHEVVARLGNYHPGEVIRGTEPFTFTAFAGRAESLTTQLGTTMKRADLLMRQATITAASVNRLVGSPELQRSLLETAANLDRASEQGLALTKEIQSDVARDNLQARMALGNVADTTGQFRSLASDNRRKLDSMIEHMNRTTASLDRMTSDLNQQMQQGHMTANLSDTLANLKRASAELVQIEDDVHGMTGNEQFRTSIKTAVQNVAQASGNAAGLVQRLSAITGGRFHPLGRNAPNFEGRLDFTQNFRTNNFRTDFDLYAPLSSIDFARVGIYDLTGENRLNLQYGARASYNSPFDYRAGVYAGKVGIGGDYDLFGGNTISLDLYNPNRLQLDARGHIPLNRQVGLWLGVEDIPRTNGVTLGIELRR